MVHLSGQILKLIDSELSFWELHKKFLQATPKIFSLYQTAINLYNVKDNIPSNHLPDVNSVTMTDRRNLRQTLVRNNRYRISLNIVKNRLRSIPNIIDKTWMDKNVKDFKLCCKRRIIQDSLESL